MDGSSDIWDFMSKVPSQQLGQAPHRASLVESNRQFLSSLACRSFHWWLDRQVGSAHLPFQ